MEIQFLLTEIQFVLIDGKNLVWNHRNLISINENSLHADIYFLLTKSQLLLTEF